MQNMKQTKIINTKPSLDTQGNLISAHGGGILEHNGIFYWYGASYKKNEIGYANYYDYISKALCKGEKLNGYHTSDPTTWTPIFDGFNVYASTDLVNWEYKGKAYNAPEKGWNRLHASHRPHVVYNPSTEKYVMFMYYYIYYPGCLMLVATSSNPTGPFELHGAIETGSLSGHVGDMNVFVDDDDQAYLIYDDCCFDIRIDSLSGDFLSSNKEGKLIMPKKSEAPAMIKYKGKYIVAASGVDSWNLTPTYICHADSPLGDYSEKKLIKTTNNWQGQLSDMIYVPEHDCILMIFDQWFHPDKNNIDKSGYIFLPIDFNLATGEAAMPFLPEWNPFSNTKNSHL